MEIKNDFILLKDAPKFKEKAKIIDIQNDLKEIMKYEINDDGVANKTKFTEIKNDDVIDF